VIKLSKNTIYAKTRFPFGTFWSTMDQFKGANMSINVKLSENLVEQAKAYGQIEHRSVPKQIEYWSQIGRVAQENPDLPFSIIREILIADQEPIIGEYVFS
jgi:hypothetical protein